MLASVPLAVLALIAALCSTLSSAAPVLAKREPHPAAIVSPASGSTLHVGQAFHFVFRDGEAFPDSVDVRLASTSSGASYELGDVPFSDYSADASLTVASSVPAGSYNLVAQEKSSSDPDGSEWSTVSEPVEVVQ